jgi:LPS-assembly protein
VGLRVTRYGTSLKASPLNRLLGEFSADLRPPAFEKVFSRPYRGYRLKHVIEPDIRYRLVRARDKEDIVNIVRFDQVDILAETNEVEYSLTNTILARKDVPDDQAEKSQARELVSLRLSQKYYFDPTFGGALEPGRKVVFDPTISLTGFAFAQGRRLSPVVSVFKLAPSSNYDTELRADFNPSGGGVLNAGITSHLHRGPLGLAFTDFFINRTAALSTPLPLAASLSRLPSFNLLRTVVTYGDVSRKGFSGAFGLDYNFAQGIAHQVVSQVSYNFGCFGLDFEYRRFALGALRRENRFRVAFSLANFGTFGNLKSRERLYTDGHGPGSLVGGNSRPY